MLGSGPTLMASMAYSTWNRRPCGSACGWYQERLQLGEVKVILVYSAEQSGLDLHGGGTGWSGELKRSKLTSGEKVLTPRSYSDLIVSISVYSNPPGEGKVEVRE